MKFKKTAVVLALATLVLNSVTAGATFSGQYPNNINYTAAGGPQVQQTQRAIEWDKTNNAATHQAYTFYVGGQGFTLLDTDAEGNYLTVSANRYGNQSNLKRFTSGIATGTVKKETSSSADYNYNPENKNNIAYYMDNAFVGNLPAVIQNNIVGIKPGTEKPFWKVEDEYVLISDYDRSTIEGSDTLKPRYDAWLARNKKPIREIQAAVVIPSYREVEKYKEKIAIPLTQPEWYGPEIRTIFQHVTLSNGDIRFNAKGYVIRILGDNKTMYVTADGEIDNMGYLILPMFKLDKDFFANVAVDCDTAGTEVKAEIVRQDIDTLKNLYTDAELLTLGIDVTKLPEASNVSLTGLRAAGAATELCYDFVGKDGRTEGASKYEIYVSDTKDGEYVRNETLTQWQGLSSDYANKYIKVAVIPVDDLGKIGLRGVSNVYHIEETPANAYVSSVAISDASTAISATASVVNSGTDDDIKVTVAQYDSNNCMLGIAVSQSGTTTATLNKVQGAVYAKVMVAVNNKPVYLKTVD